MTAGLGRARLGGVGQGWVEQSEVGQGGTEVVRGGGWERGLDQ